MFRAGPAFASMCAAAFCTAVVACGSGESAENARVVSGVVRDATTGDALGGVSVAFRSDTLDIAQARTSESGKYELSVESRSLHGRVEARKAGYATQVASVYFDDVAVTVDIALSRK